MPIDTETIIHQIPGWGNASSLQTGALDGLTNTNTLVTVNGERFVLRVSGENTAPLGIRRDLEIKALRAASAAGIAPELVHAILPEGHLVTRYIDGHHLELEEYRTQKNLARIVGTLKRLHGLPPVEAAFSPFRRVTAYARQARAMGVPFPADFDALTQRMDQIRQAQQRDTAPWHRFCHNDLFCVNVIDDGKIWFLDWEFAGMGDLYFDLATLMYAYDSLNTLPRDLQAYVLECYFGEVTEQNWSRLAGMQFMLLFFTAMWGLLQEGLRRKGLVQAIEGFDFLEYAEETFEAMRTVLR